MTFLSVIGSAGANGVTALQGGLAGVIVGSEHATASFPYWPILLVVAILIPLMIVAFKKVSNK